MLNSSISSPTLFSSQLENRFTHLCTLCTLDMRGIDKLVRCSVLARCYALPPPLLALEKFIPLCTDLGLGLCRAIAAHQHIHILEYVFERDSISLISFSKQLCERNRTPHFHMESFRTHCWKIALYQCEPEDSGTVRFIKYVVIPIDNQTFILTHLFASNPSPPRS